jgi:hypothetical protein
MSGVSLKGKISGAGAKDWASAANNPEFTIHESGKSKEKPKPGDALVWGSGQYGHIAILTNVVDVRGTEQYSVLSCVQANTNSPYCEEIILYKNSSNIYFIMNQSKKTAEEKAWVPSYWLRKK